jgi:hypothetical protein
MCRNYKTSLNEVKIFPLKITNTIKLYVIACPTKFLKMFILLNQIFYKLDGPKLNKKITINIHYQAQNVAGRKGMV